MSKRIAFLCASGASLFFAATLLGQSILTFNTSSTLSDVAIRGGTFAATNFEGDVLVTRISSDATYTRRSLLEFNLGTAIPRDAVIQSATLELTVKWGGTTAQRAVGVYPVTRDFTARAATWDTATAQTAWTTPGGDLGARVAVASVPNVEGSHVTFNVTSIIANAIRTSPAVARMALLDVDTLTNARAGYREYFPVEASDARARPTLTITYGPSGSTASLPRFSRVFLIVFENREYGDIVGNASAPYLNSLTHQYGLATAYTAVSHPSLPNYMALTGGETVFTSDCQGCTTTDASVADQIEQSGRTWKAYLEAMPSPCDTVDSGLYAQKHNPFVHYAGIVNHTSRCDAHVVPLTAFDTDVKNGTLPNLVWITPDLCHDMHDCSTATGDTWLSTFLPKITGLADFNQSAVFIAWDEGRTTTGGGGHVPLLVVSPLTRPGTQSARALNHDSVLRTIESAWGLPALGHAASASTLLDFFK